MKSFAILSFFYMISSVASQSLRNEYVFEEDVINRELSSECGLGSTYSGCFEDRLKDRALPYQVDGQDHSAEDCEAACKSEGYTIFGRQWKGQCFCGNTGDSHDQHGNAKDCDCCGDNVGGRKMCVWMTSNYLGCYMNKNKDRALPYKVDGRRHTTGECQAACTSKNMKYFAREWMGQCFCSDDEDYGKHGKASGCDCEAKNVGANKMCVYST